MRVAVVGAGLGGLAAACHLAGKGHEVKVFERSDAPGGRAGRWSAAGFHFDTGPTVLTMRGVLADAFAAAGARMEDHVDLLAVDPMYRAVFAEGGEIRVRRGRGAMAEEIRTQCGPRDAAGFQRYCTWLTELYRLEQPNFIDRNWDSPLQLATPAALALVRAGGFRRMASVVADYFRDPRLQKLFSFQAMYAGLSPFDALAIYCVITYMDTVEGVWFPRGGLHEVARGLAAAAGAAGVEFAYGAAVEAVARSGRRVSGLRLVDGTVVRADAVVANPDLPWVYRHLLPDGHVPRHVDHGRYSPSAAVWLAGVRGSLPRGAAHHNVHFGAAWKDAFDDLLRDGRRMQDPSILVSAPTITDASVAPEGCVPLYVLEPVPNLDGRVDWAVERDRLRVDLAARVAGLGYPDDVVVDRFLDPTDWAAQGMERGTPFALAHHFFQTGPFRPANRSRQAPGLFFTGSGTQPGVGVPMVLLSGRLAAERVDRYARR